MANIVVLCLLQMSFWMLTDPCILTYTALFDVFVDTFFLVYPLTAWNGNIRIRRGKGNIIHILVPFRKSRDDSTTLTKIGVNDIGCLHWAAAGYHNKLLHWILWWWWVVHRRHAHRRCESAGKPSLTLPGWEILRYFKRMDSSLEIPEDTVQILVRFGHLGAVLILRSHLVWGESFRLRIHLWQRSTWHEQQIKIGVNLIPFPMELTRNPE